jgi:outer membrane cobalamin receptor
LPLDKNSQETTRNKIIPYHSQHSLKLNVQYKFESFITNIHYRLFGKRFVTVANTVELAPYNVLDVSFQQTLNIGKINSSLIFTINNLTNEQYELARNYPMPGREFRLGLTLTY